MLSKGKEIILGKLRIMTLIGAGVQNTIRMCLNNRDEKITEKEKIFSKANCQTRKNFLIESEILQKSFPFDNSLLIVKNTSY